MNDKRKSHSPQEIPKGRPVFADSQRKKILAILRQAGSAGVPREDLFFRYRWTQAGTRIYELERMGFEIKHVSLVGERFVRYVLVSEPAEVKPLPFQRKSAEWCEQRLTGLPLFDQGARR